MVRPEPGSGVQGPIIVLTYPHAGDRELARLLSASRAVACTNRTGVLPLCQAALSTWRSVENREEPSALAVRSVRSMVSAMAAVLQSGTGATRWCETAFAGQDVAETFLRIFPEATFICLHRCLPAVIAEGLGAYPWGLGTSPFWPHAAEHPGNSVATIGAFWASRTEQILAFEDAHPLSCLRVQYEDLAAAPRQRGAEIFARLGLDPRDLATPGEAADAPGPAAAAPPLPSGQLPPRLLARVSDLHARLGLESLLPEA